MSAIMAELIGLKRVIQVRSSTADLTKRDRVEAEVFGPLAIYPRVGMWSVGHVDSGYHIEHLLTEAQARTLVLLLLELDWTGPAKELYRHRPAVEAAVAKVRGL